MVLAEGARVFLEALPYEAGEKIACSIRCVKDGEISRELFKRLDDSDGIRGYGLFTAGLPTAFLPFGTQKVKHL